MNALIVSNVVLWVLVVGLSLAVFALTRQIGVLHERVSPAGALTFSGGVKAGEALPNLTLSTLDGRTLTLDAYAANGRGVLLFFLSPTCPLCRALLPVVTKIAKEERRWLDLVFASDGGTLDEHTTYVAERQLEAFPYVISQELGVAFRVGKLPYAALIDENGVLVAKGLVNTREHLESLLEARRLGVASVNEYMGAQARDDEVNA